MSRRDDIQGKHHISKDKKKISSMIVYKFKNYIDYISNVLCDDSDIPGMLDL